MVSYAFRRGCTNIILVYPTLSENINQPDSSQINSGSNNADKINITAIEIPFWSISDFNEKI